MAGWRGIRKLKIDIEKAKKVQKLISKCKNNTERKRVMIISIYLKWKSIEETVKILSSSTKTVCETIGLYQEDQEWFFKTNYKWKIESKNRKELKLEIKEFVDKKIEKQENIDINEVLRHINRKYNQEILNYNWIWWLLRKRFKYNYQKPFVTNKKKSKHAKEIIKWRLTKTIIEIWKEEFDVDAVTIKNKKTKFWEIIG